MNSDKFEKVTPIIGRAFGKNKKNMFFWAVILVVSLMAYLPSLQSGFVNWDDDSNVYLNPYVTTSSDPGSLFENAKEIFTTPVYNAYNPLVILSFAFENMFFGLDSPGWWHLNNIILHLICVFLVFRIALALGLKSAPAAFCALLFGIHPMRVESVAWITQRRDVLYGAFYLLALYYYIKSVKSSSPKRYLLIIGLSFVSSLLSKIQAVTLPLSMLLVDHYFDRKISLKLVYEKWFYFLFSAATGVVGIYLLRENNAVNLNEFYPLLNRIFYGSYSYVIYLIKSVVPYKMVPLYPFPEASAQIGLVFYCSMLLALSVLAATYYFFLKKNKVLVFGLLFFTFNVMFVLQISIGGNAFIADRYTYIAYLGLFFIYASGFQWLLNKYEKFDKLIYGFALIILGIFGYLSFEQNKIWKNGETLWSHELKYYDTVPVVWRKRAAYYYSVGRLEEALNDYSKVVTLTSSNPTPAAYNSRGVTYARLNMFDNALRDFNEALKLDSNHYLTYKNRGLLYFNFGYYDKAKLDIETYLSLNQDDPEMRAKLGMINKMRERIENLAGDNNRALPIGKGRLPGQVSLENGQ